MQFPPAAHCSVLLGFCFASYKLRGALPAIKLPHVTVLYHTLLAPLQGTSVALPSTASINSADTGAITALCTQYCGAGSGSSGSNGGSDSGGGFPAPPSNSSSPSPTAGSRSPEASSGLVPVSSPPAAPSPPVSSDPDQLLI